MSATLITLLIGLTCIGLLILAVVGVVVLVVVTLKRSRKIEAIPANWVAIRGRVINASVEEGARTRADEDSFYQGRIEFEYIVEGRIYTSKQAVGKLTNLEYLAKQTIKRYPAETEVAVCYNPEKPGEAKLITN